jgi:TRAP-type C4-dicarboxylate transport system permease small subunit
LTVRTASLLEHWRRLLGLLGRAEQALVVVLLVNIVLNILAQVISRYFFGKPLVWVEEVATYSLIWATVLGAALALKHDRHVKIDTFVGRLPPRGGAVARAVVMLVLVVLLLTLLPALAAAIEVEMRRRTIALPVQIPSGWFFSVPLTVGAVSMLATALYRLAAELRFAMGGPALRPIMRPLPVETDDDDAVAAALSGRRP